MKYNGVRAFRQDAIRHSRKQSQDCDLSVCYKPGRGFGVFHLHLALWQPGLSPQPRQCMPPLRLSSSPPLTTLRLHTMHMRGYAWRCVVW